MARRQQARAFELRAAMALARVPEHSARRALRCCAPWTASRPTRPTRISARPARSSGSDGGRAPREEAGRDPGRRHGGPCGGMVAQRAEARDEFDVTVYQRGWRLGGKAASSRGVNGRIEEHGLHVWLGYYDNAFRLVRDVYDELDRATTDPACPIATWRHAFSPAERVGVGDGFGDDWSHWVATFGQNDEEPGGSRRPRASSVRGGVRPQGPSPPAGLLLRRYGESRCRPASCSAAGPIRRRRAAPRSPLAEMGARAAPSRDRGHGRAPWRRSGCSRPRCRAAGRLRQRCSRTSRACATTWPRDCAGDTTAAGPAEVADLVITCLQGAIRDGLLLQPAGFAAIDDSTSGSGWRATARVRDAADSPIVRGMYDLVFAYEDGDPRRPRFAAGLGLFLAGKLFFEYRGSIFWRMQAGSGDVVFAPLYQALRARGVRFAFFHRVDQLHVSDDGGSIEAVSAGPAGAAGSTGAGSTTRWCASRACRASRSRPLVEQLVAAPHPRPRVRLGRSQLRGADGPARRRGLRRPRARDVARDGPSCLRRADRALAALARDGRPRGNGAHPVAADLAAQA